MIIRTIIMMIQQSKQQHQENAGVHAYTTASTTSQRKGSKSTIPHKQVMASNTKHLQR